MNGFRSAMAPAVIRLRVHSNRMSFESGVLLEALQFKWQQAKHIGKLELLELTSDC